MHRKEGTANTEKRHDFLGVPYSIYCCSSRTVVRISGTDFEELHSRIFSEKDEHKFSEISLYFC